MSHAAHNCLFVCFPCFYVIYLYHTSTIVFVEVGVMKTCVACMVSDSVCNEQTQTQEICYFIFHHISVNNISLVITGTH